MKPLPRALLALALFWLAFLIFREAHTAYSAPEVDSSKVVLLFGSLVLVGGAAGILVVTFILPMVGDAIGNFFWSPDERPEKSPHADALAAVARGEYHEAIEEYRNAFETDPTDCLAVSEIAKLYCEKLGEPESAIDVLEQVLAADWAPDQSSFLRTRLADIRWEYQQDARAARELLLAIIGDYPGTPQSASATHKLQELERAITAADSQLPQS